MKKNYFLIALSFVCLITISNLKAQTNTDIIYGVLPLQYSYSSINDYDENHIGNKTTTTKSNLESGNFVFTFTFPGRMIFVVPYSAGGITSLLDALGNDIFSGYFNIFQDNVNNNTIYVAKEFLTAGDYSLTLSFSEPILSTQFFKKELVKIYPNPSYDLIFVENIEVGKSFQIFDNLGKEIVNTEMNDSKKINIQKLKKGIYFLKFKEIDKTIKFIKK